MPFDFSEIPSHLVECFVQDYEFVRLWASDHVSGETLSRGVFEKIITTERMLDSFSLENTAYLSLLDHYVHSSPDPLNVDDIKKTERRLFEEGFASNFEKAPAGIEKREAGSEDNAFFEVY